MDPKFGMRVNYDDITLYDIAAWQVIWRHSVRFSGKNTDPEGIMQEDASTLRYFHKIRQSSQSSMSENLE